MRIYEFECNHAQCKTHLTSSEKDHLMRQIAEHLKTAHNIPKPTQTIMSYLEATCVRESWS